MLKKKVKVKKGLWEHIILSLLLILCIFSSSSSFIEMEISFFDKKGKKREGHISRFIDTDMLSDKKDLQMLNNRQPISFFNLKSHQQLFQLTVTVLLYCTLCSSIALP